MYISIVISCIATLEMWIFCCDKCPCGNLPDQEIDYLYSDTSPSITFYIYHQKLYCTTYGRIPLNDKKVCCIFKQDPASEKSIKIYTRKELVMMETTLYNFYTSFYIPEIQRLEFHIPHVQIMDTNHCGDSGQTAFKRRESF